MFRDIVLAVLALSMAACGTSEEGRSRSSAPAMTAEGLLFGGDSCRMDGDCVSNACVLERCLGFLTTASWPGRERVRTALHNALAEPGIQRGIREAAAEILDDPEADPIVRGRAALALGELPLDDVREMLSRALQDSDEAVRFFAAAALYRAGDVSGGVALRTWAGHPAEAVRNLSAALLDEGPRRDQKPADDSTQ